jgi:hypothetical protein
MWGGSEDENLEAYLETIDRFLVDLREAGKQNLEVVLNKAESTLVSNPVGKANAPALHKVLSR